ncbi:GTP-binding family protein [Artemisia annua]|uniref:GTP-binding family protein n=1 Tax=Artemisia annua TaxID=35608 RepID=A0A2U1KQP7_ARTAN|nr:GTP-binding family protein [Artemisia annua]
MELELTSFLILLAPTIVGLYTGLEVENKDEDYIPSTAIAGRPNVGKSSILNALVRKDITIVSPVSGTTCDAIDTEFEGPNGHNFSLIDTIGIRKTKFVASSGSTTEALSDYKIDERIEREGKGCLIVVNKWDTIPNKNQQATSHYNEDVRTKLRILNLAPIVYSTTLAWNSVDT